MEMRKIISLLKDPRHLLLSLAEHGFFNWMPDKLYLKLVFRLRIGQKLRINCPQTFNEKIQWLKLYDRRREYTEMTDKCLAREYISSRIGEEYLVPILGIWDKAEDIDFSKLPEQFVLKCNHDSGSTVVCRDKKSFSEADAVNTLKKKLRRNAFWGGREWQYKNIGRKVLAEKYLEDDASGELTDYKLLCFNGRVKCSFVVTKRFYDEGMHVTFYDRQWNRLPFERHYPADKTDIDKPENYEKMLEIAEELSKNHAFLRVDFYESDKKLYIGELTLHPGSGFEEFSPREWDDVLGGWLKLPTEKICEKV